MKTLLSPLVILYLFVFLFSLQSEAQSFEEHYEQTVLPFYKSVPERFLHRPENIELSYKAFEHPFEVGAIIFVTGWTETHRKYAELIWDLYQAGFSVYSMDHRGMGFSTRLTSNPQQVHVETVDDYVKDLKAFVDEIVRPPTHQKNYFISHSMGGLVTALYLERYSSSIDAAVFSAPLFQLNTGQIPERLAYRITQREVKRGNGKQYAMTQGDTTYEKASDFCAQRTTHSFKRWKKKIANWAEFPILLQGGSTNSWVFSVLEKTFFLLSGAWKGMPVPSLILESSDDIYVINKGHHKVCHQAQNCQLKKYPHSYHELYLETDSVRSFALKDTLQFLANQ